MQLQHDHWGVSQTAAVNGETFAAVFCRDCELNLGLFITSVEHVRHKPPRQMQWLKQLFLLVTIPERQICMHASSSTVFTLPPRLPTRTAS
jgi:hypothetical protein